MSRILYDPQMHRWFDATGSMAKNAIFLEGYDDPTYLTFRVEFGDWGASVLNRATISAGVTNTNVYQSDYDALPIGLLNCPWPGKNYDPTEWQTNAGNKADIFNNIKNYSAFTYLRSRNEDARAEYIYYFVNGLFEIQKNTPYIFESISGLNNLDSFDPTKGRRIADAQITLKCQESLQLKIKTLMELYRKAAYDDVYQRWILPVNLRQFKMIIYVFERRVFQNSYFGLDKINYDLPVKAYECSPCEFQIKSTAPDSLDQTYGSSEAASTDLIINVSNVKTYFTNGLLNGQAAQIYKNSSAENIGSQLNLNDKLSGIMIYDLVESLERMTPDDGMFSNSGTSSAYTLNSIRRNFMHKNVFLANEEYSHVGDENLTWIYMSGAVDPDDLKFSKSNWLEKLATLSYKLAGLNGHPVMAGGDKSLLEGAKHPNWVGELIDALLGLNDKFSIDVHRHKYIHIHKNERVKPNHKFRELLKPRFVDALGFEQKQSLTSIANERQISETYFNMLHTPRQLVKQEYEQMHDDRNVSQQTYINILKERQKPSFEQNPDMQGREKSNDDIQLNMSNRLIVEQDLNELYDPRQTPDHDYQQMLNPRQSAEQSLQSLSHERQKNDQTYIEMQDEREQTEQHYYELIHERKKDVQQMNKPINTERAINNTNIELTDARQIPEQNMNEIIDNKRDIKYNDYQLSDVKREQPKIYDVLSALRTVPGLENIKLDDVRDIPENKYQNIIDESDKSGETMIVNKMELIETISKAIDEPSEQFIKIDNENKQRESELSKTLNNKKLFDSIDSLDDETKSNIKLVELFASKREQLQQALAKELIQLKNALKESSIKMVDNLPLNDLYMKTDNNDNDDTVMIRIDEAEQVDKNIKLISIPDDAIKQMSLTALVALLDEAGNEKTNTDAMIRIPDSKKE